MGIPADDKSRLSSVEAFCKEYIGRSEELQAENINSLNEVMESLKTSIRESLKQKLAVRYAENA